MPMKFDKETLIKQRFWIMLGVAFILALAGIGYLEIAVGADSVVQDIKKKLSSASSKGQVNNKDTIDARRKDAEKVQKAEAIVWKDAYDKQAKAFGWGKDFEKQFNFTNGKFANEIKLLKMADPKSWPADKEGEIVHGTWKDQNKDFLIIKTRTGQEITLNRTPNVDNILIPDWTKKGGPARL